MTRLAPLLPLLGALLLGLPGAPALAGVDGDARLDICYNYGCMVQAPVTVPSTELDALAQAVSSATDAPTERDAVARAIGALFAIAAQQSPIAADRPGNYDDGGVRGQMDCIDHSTNTTRFLELLAARGALHFHDVGPRLRRGLLFRHYAAHLTSRDGSGDYAIDSWYTPVGAPPLVLPLARWQTGATTP